MMERKLDKEATILYSNETESEVRRWKECISMKMEVETQKAG